MIIGLTANIGAGKDTVAKMIQFYFFQKNKPNSSEITLMQFLEGQDLYDNDYSFGELTEYKISEDSGWKIKKFAFKLKETISSFTGCTLEQLEDSVFKEEFCYNVTTGEIKHISFLENECVIKNVMQEYPINSWITFRVVLQDIGMKLRSSMPEIHINGLFSKYNENENWIISDLRLLNEASSIKNRNGAIIRIERYDGKFHSHRSETELSSICQEYTIVNAGTLEDLYLNVVVALNALKEKNLITF